MEKLTDWGSGNYKYIRRDGIYTDGDKENYKEEMRMRWGIERLAK